MIIGVFAVAMFIISYTLSDILASIFVGYDKSLFEITTRAFSIFSYSFLFMGFAIFSSSFFTALNNGLISAIISFLRTLVFQAASVLILPFIWGVDGIWVSMVVAEIMAAIISIFFIIINRNKYKYL